MPIEQNGGLTSKQKQNVESAVEKLKAAGKTKDEILKVVEHMQSAYLTQSKEISKPKKAQTEDGKLDSSLVDGKFTLDSTEGVKVDGEKFPQLRLPTEEELEEIHKDAPTIEIKTIAGVPVTEVKPITPEMTTAAALERTTISSLAGSKQEREELQTTSDINTLVGIGTDMEDEFIRSSTQEGRSPEFNRLFRNKFIKDSKVKVAQLETSSELIEDPNKNYPELVDKNYQDLNISSIFSDSELEGVDIKAFRDYLVSSGIASKYTNELEPYSDNAYAENSETEQAYRYKTLSGFLNNQRGKAIKDQIIYKARIENNIGDKEASTKGYNQARSYVVQSGLELVNQINKYDKVKERSETFKQKENEWREYLLSDEISPIREMKHLGQKAWNGFSKVILGTAGSVYKILGDALPGDDFNFLHSTAAQTNVLQDIVSFDVPSLQKVYVTTKSVTVRGEDYQIEKDNIYQDGILLDKSTLGNELINEIKNEAKTIKEASSTISKRALATGVIDLVSQIYLMTRTAKALPIKNYTASAGFTGVLQTHNDKYEEVKESLELAIQSGELDIPQGDIDGLANMNAYLNSSVVFAAGMFSPNKVVAGIKDSSMKTLVKELYSKESNKTIQKKISDFLSINLTESIKEVIQEETELIAEKQINAITNLLVNKEILNEDLTMDEIVETGLITFLGTGMVTGVSQARSGGVDTYSIKKTLASKDSGDLKKVINEVIKDEELTKVEGEKLFNSIFDIKKYDSKIPEGVKNEKRDEIVPLIKKKEKLIKESKEMDSSFKESYDKKIEKVDGDIKEVLLKKIKEIEDVIVKGDDKVIEEAPTKDAKESKELRDIKDSYKKVADTIRKGKIYKSPEAFNKLQSNPLGLAVVVWDGAIETVAKTVELTGNLDSAIRKGIKEIKKTEWYSKLTKDNKAQAIKIFEDDIRPKLKPLEASIIKVKATPIITRIKRTVGMIDTSKKVITTEAKLFKEKFKILLRGYKEGAKEAGNLKRDFIETTKITLDRIKEDITPAEYKTILNQVRNLNFKNIDKLRVVIDNLAGRVETRSLKKRYGGKLKKNIKKAKRNAKRYFGKSGSKVEFLAMLPLDLIPEDSKEELFQVFKGLAENEDPDFKKVNELYERYKQVIIDEVDRKYEEKSKEVEVKKGDLKDEVLMIGELQKVRKTDMSHLMNYEQDIIQDFLKIPDTYLLDLPKSDKSKITKALMQAAQGRLVNKILNITTIKYRSLETAKDIKDKVGDTLLTPVKGMSNLLSKTKAKDFTSSSLTVKMSRVMLQHIDRTVKGITGSTFYNNVIQPVTSAYNAADTESTEVSNRIGKLVSLSKTAREGGRLKRLVKTVKQGLGVQIGSYEFELNIILQLKFRQDEYNSNKVLKGKKVHPLKDHMEALNKGFTLTPYNKDDVDYINKVYDKFKSSDGNIDVEKINNYLNEAESELVKEIRSEIELSEGRSREVNDHLKGESLTYTENYFPRSQYDTRGVPSKDSGEGFISRDPSVKAGASFERKNFVGALDFNTLGNFNNYFRESTAEYRLTYPKKAVGIILTDLKKSDNRTLVKVAKALEVSLNNLYNVQASRPGIEDRKRDRIFKSFIRKSFNRMLIDPIRLSFDTLVNYSTVYLANIDRLPNIIKAGRKFDKEFIQVLNKNFTSTQSERLGGARSVDYKEVQTSTVSKSRFKKVNPGLFESLTDLYNKNTITDASDKASDFYYKISDMPAKQLWKMYLMDEFKKNTGEELNADKFKESREYRGKFKIEIQKSITVADKMTSNLFNTATRAEQKLHIQAKSQDWLTRFNSFMRSFTFNENQVFWDSLQGMFGRGTIESRTEAARTFAIVNTRSIAYSVAAQTILGAILGFIFPEDEEEKKERYEKAWNRALAQHGMLIFAGNRGAIFGIVAGMIFEGMNMAYKEGVKDETYNSFDHSLLFVPPTRTSTSHFIGMLGAEGYALKALYDAGDLMIDLGRQVLVHGEDITEEDLIDMKVTQITMSLLSQSTGLPIDRLGKLTQKILLEELDRKAVKPMVDERKKSIFKTVTK